MDKKLYLSDTDKKICGVAGGMAEFFGLDSTILRIIWLFLACCWGSGILAYFICALVMPKKPRYHGENSDNKDYTEY